MLILLVVVPTLGDSASESSADDTPGADKLAVVERQIEQLENALVERTQAVERLSAELERLQLELSELNEQKRSASGVELHRENAAQVEQENAFLVQSFTILLMGAGLVSFITIVVLMRRSVGGGVSDKGLAGLQSPSPTWLKREGDHVVFRGGKRIRFMYAFVLLFIPTGLVRGMMISLLPLLALDLLGTPHRVSVLYLCVGIGGIMIALLLPKLTRRVGSRRVFQTGVASAVLSMCLLPFPTSALFVLGMLCHVLAVACLEIALLLFLMSSLKRDDYKYFEPIRVICAASGFVVGPLASILLYEHVSRIAPFAVTGVCVLFALVYAKALELGDTAPVLNAQSPDLFTYIRRFAVQPRLVLAWALSITRYAWFVMFFIYVPLYTMWSGLGATIGGALVSVGTAATWLAPLWGRFGRRFGLRVLYILGFFATGLFSVLAYTVASEPIMCALVLLLAVIFASIPDGASHLPFYRATRARERAEMTGVYATHRDAGQLIPPALFAFILKFLPLPVVFAASGLSMLIMTWYCRYLPRRI